MEKKQTAVQWLFKSARLDMGIYDWLLCIEHAEEMEKQQIMDAYMDAYGNTTEPEDYYNEQYGKQ
jgi:hypothetical protein